MRISIAMDTAYSLLSACASHSPFLAARLLLEVTQKCDITDSSALKQEGSTPGLEMLVFDLLAKEKVVTMHLAATLCLRQHSSNGSQVNF